jgi:hypothetical protein
MLLSTFEAAGAVPDGGVAAREAARSLAQFHEARGNAQAAENWRARAAPVANP